MDATATPAFIPLPMGIGRMMTVPLGRIMLMDNIGMYQRVYGQVRKVEIVEVERDGGTYIETKITVADGGTWQGDSRTAVRITRVTRVTD